MLGAACSTYSSFQLVHYYDALYRGGCSQVQVVIPPTLSEAIEASEAGDTASVVMASRGCRRLG